MVEEKILIVDDNEEVIEKTRSLLVEVGYDVTSCNSGKDALEFLADNQVDLVLLDINMPNMNGFDVCLRIRQRHPLDDLPIIFLTSREDSDSVTKGFQAGASDFVSKSAISEILLARVNVHIRLSRSLRNLRDISLTDDMTGCFNRRHGMYSLREWFSRSKRYGTQFAIIYFDLNGLKATNDQYGHQAGDLLLRSVSSAVKEILRETDQLFRMGGDEFLVICPETDKKGAFVCAERMQRAVSEITIVDKQASFAFGVAHSSEDYKELDDMLHSADVSMYKMKQEMREK
ncbi:MAG: diguanylate cyclase [Fibrobacter sp.]|jgi:diguanylate cyclase (GGDEF)-like protein|nr:diguanylate cyclase [Fibrobacter sp.]